jgi:hypothetical protein
MGPDGRLTFPSSEPRPSPYHTCTFSKATGYTFNITISKPQLGLTPEIIQMYNVTKIKTHVVYEDALASVNYVTTQFHIEV